MLLFLLFVVVVSADVPIPSQPHCTAFQNAQICLTERIDCYWCYDNAQCLGTRNCKVPESECHRANFSRNAKKCVSTERTGWFFVFVCWAVPIAIVMGICMVFIVRAYAPNILERPLDCSYKTTYLEI